MTVSQLKNLMSAIPPAYHGCPVYFAHEGTEHPLTIALVCPGRDGEPAKGSVLLLERFGPPESFNSHVLYIMPGDVIR